MRHGHRLGAARPQPLPLLVMREHDRGVQQLPLVQQPFGRQPEGFRLPASGFRLPASGFRLPASGFRLPASGFRLPAEFFIVSGAVGESYERGGYFMESAAAAGGHREVEGVFLRLVPGNEGKIVPRREFPYARRERGRAGAGEEELHPGVAVEDGQDVQEAGRRGDVVDDAEHGPFVGHGAPVRRESGAARPGVSLIRTGHLCTLRSAPACWKGGCPRPGRHAVGAASQAGCGSLRWPQRIRAGTHRGKGVSWKPSWRDWPRRPRRRWSV
ncbi:hypothetical protein DUI70_4323 [Streptomyces albus]|nr:hypothetical protein SLNHY_4397 [Streptomyces albus]AYN34822.1 hypothetical protein DUI70_4323 [Streptomyces albus]